MSRSPSGIADQVGRVLGDRYRLVAPIGTGASAQVHLADDLRLGRRVAVKVLHPALAADETFLRRFRAEARSAAALSHPNIMAVYDWGDGQGPSGPGSGEHEPFLVLELLSGGSLRSILDSGTTLTLSQALVVGLEAGRALEAAHRSGFVHRDIKPANLLFGSDSRLRIADFGLARALSEAAWTEPGDGLVGTARYAAPEQASGGRVDGKADVYALALVLIEAVTGEVPRVADSALATIRLRADGPVPVPDEMGVMKEVLEAALVPDPEARPDATAMVQALLVAARQLERPAPLPLVGLADPAPDATEDDDDDATVLPARPPADLTVHAEPGTAAAPPKRRWWKVLVALLVVVAIVVGALLLWRSTQAPTAVIPNVAGQTESAAREAIEAVEVAEGGDVDWTIESEGEFSDGVEAGVVIRTDPPGTSELADGGTIMLVVSDGPEPVPVPDLFNYTQPEAESILADAQLTVGTVTPVFDETVAEGRVIQWGTADAGDKPAELPKGSPVDLTISQGPAPRVVPQLNGAPRAQAESELAEMGLEVSVREDFSDDVEAGLVIGTEPGAGAELERGASVALIVSKGPDLVEVPNVVGMSFDEATETLEGAGFSVSAQGPTRGTVFESDPGAGERVRRGAEVTIYLRR